MEQKDLLRQLDSTPNLSSAYFTTTYSNVVAVMCMLSMVIYVELSHEWNPDLKFLLFLGTLRYSRAVKETLNMCLLQNWSL